MTGVEFAAWLTGRGWEIVEASDLRIEATIGGVKSRVWERFDDGSWRITGKATIK